MPLDTQNAVNQAADQQTKIDQFNPPSRIDGQASEPSYLKYSRMAGIGGSAADWLSTYSALKKGNKEDNPTLQWTHNKPALTALAGAGEDALVGLLLERALKNHPKILSGIYLGRAGEGAYLAHQNFSLPVDPRGKR
jgi:hypothetical protein